MALLWKGIEMRPTKEQITAYLQENYDEGSIVNVLKMVNHFIDETMKDAIVIPEWPDGADRAWIQFACGNQNMPYKSTTIIRPKQTLKFSVGETVFISCAGPNPVVAVIIDINLSSEFPYVIDYFGRNSKHAVSNNSDFIKKFDPKFIGKPWSEI